jgi:hypothetical protein
VRRNATTGTYKFFVWLFAKRYDDKKERCMKNGIQDLAAATKSEDFKEHLEKRVGEGHFFFCTVQRRVKRVGEYHACTLLQLAGHARSQDSGAMRPYMRRRGSPEGGLEESFGSLFVPLKFQNLKGVRGAKNLACSSAGGGGLVGGPPLWPRFWGG